MILSASRRTDLPAFYGEWFLNRLHAGEVWVRNPMNLRQVRRVALSPETVEGIVFWSKDPRSLLGRLDELDELGYRYYFQFTLTPYGPDVEPGLRDKRAILRDFRALAQRLGPQRVLWRYDPILLSERYTLPWHREAFAQLCRALRDSTRRVTISFVDQYRKQGKRMPRAILPEEMAALGEALGAIARAHGLTPMACCEPLDLAPYGIERGRCIDRELLEALCGHPLPLRPARSQRPGCGCCESVDVGAYDSCAHGCTYCYASHSADRAAANLARHDPAGMFLLDACGGRGRA